MNMFQLKRKTKRKRVVSLIRVKGHEYGIFNVVISFLTVPLSIERADLHFRSSQRNSYYPNKGYFLLPELSGIREVQ